MIRTLSLVLALAISAPLAAQSVNWSTKSAHRSLVYNTGPVIGQPDGTATALDYYDTTWVRDFQPGKISAAALEKGLKLPAGELAKWDIIAFEAHHADGHGMPFDSALWMVTDLTNISASSYDPVNSGGTYADAKSGWKFRSGPISVAEYKALFPGSKLYGPAGWILIKLPPGVDKKSPMFSVWLSENHSLQNNGIPAPESIGVIR
jgi:hypothetical protein